MVKKGFKEFKLDAGVRERSHGLTTEWEVDVVARDIAKQNEPNGAKGNKTCMFADERTHGLR